MAIKQILNSGMASDGSFYVSMADGAGNLLPVQTTGFPSGAIPITASATGTTGSTVATLAGVANKTTYIAGFTITADATAAIAGAATISGTVTGSLNFIQNVGSVTAAGVLQQNFIPPIPASAVNTAIVITSLAAGTGGSTAVSAWG